MRPTLSLRPCFVALECAAAVALAAGLCAGAEPARPAGAARPAASRDPLQRPITASFIGVPLREALQLIERTSGARIRPLWADEDHADGLDAERPVSLYVRAVTAISAIETLLAQADAQTAPTWQVADDGALELGPRSRLNARKSTRIYDIRDLVRPTPDFTDAPTIDLAAALRPDGGVPLRGGDEQSRFHDPDTEPAHDLIDLITATVEPEQWLANGGSGATIQLYQGQLVIHAPGYIHRQVAGWRGS